MGEVITEYGKLAGACGHDGTDWIKLLVDEDGKLQITIDTSALPEGAATSANQLTMITALQLIDDLRNALDSVGTDEIDVNVEESVLPSGAATSANQSTIITAVQSLQNLVGALDSVDIDELVVNVDESVLPTGASTSANQSTAITALQSIQNLVGALHDVGVDELDINIVSQSADVEVKQTTPADLVAACHQYDGSAWRKSNLLWGYHDIWDENLTGTATGASYTANTSDIPAGEVWVLQAVSIRNHTRAAGLTLIYVVRASGAILDLGYVASMVLNEPLLWSGEIALVAGDVLYVYTAGTQVNDSIYAGMAGYKMDIAM